MNDAERARFRADVHAGLNAKNKEIPCKYLYDGRGSELFEAICQTRDYYVTRADLALHEAHLDDIVRCIGPDAHIVELGSGAGVKIRTILAAADRPRAYTAIEISADALEAAAAELREAFPEIEILPVQADYTRPIPSDKFSLDPPASRRVVYFPGSTISNFERDEARRFLERLGGMAEPGGGILIGVDLVKPEPVLTAAYNDSEGVTAEFNLNLLKRLQRDLGADLDRSAFRHSARYNADLQRIEMHLVANRDTAIELDGKTYPLAAGATIHTENSHKYSITDFRRLAGEAGLAIHETWTDPEGLFSMHYLEKAENGEWKMENGKPSVRKRAS